MRRAAGRRGRRWRRGYCRRGPRGQSKDSNQGARLVGRPVQVEIPAESRSDVSAHGFWKRGTTPMFDIRIVNPDVGTYLCMTPEEALAKAEKEKKDLYLQACLERRRNFTPMVYSVDRIPRVEALSTQKRLAALLSYNLKQDYP